MKKTLVASLAEQAAEPDGLSPFDRFRDLARRLVAVRKADVDAIGDAEQRAKAERPTKPAP